MNRPSATSSSRPQPRCALQNANELLDPLRPRRGVVSRVVSPSSVGADRRADHAPRPSETPREYCREARRLRAVFQHDPVRMHRQLSRLSVTAAATGQTLPVEAPEARRSTPLRWTWARTSHLSKHGISLLSQLGLGLSMAASEDAPDLAGDTDDDYPRYTLVDPEDPLPIDQGYPTSPDRSFTDLVARTLLKPHARLLRYSQRLALLKEAGRRGIGRFEANLMIASVQHRLKLVAPPNHGRRLNLSGAIAFVFVQSLILIGFWKLIRS